MDHKHKKFDAEKLFALKNNFFGYKFCPLCRSELKQTELDGHQRMVCTSEECSFIYYHNPIPAAGGIIVEDEKILLVKRAHPPKIGWWCLPAGFMEWHEHPSQTAVREIAEETGLDVKLTDFFEVYSGSDDPRSNAVLILYLAEIFGGEMKAMDDALEVAFFPFDNLPDKIAFEAHIQALKDYRERFLK